MKLVILMYLEADETCVQRLVADQRVRVFTRLAVEGVKPGPASGWYGTAAPYRSHMIVAFLEGPDAERLLEAVRRCREVADPRHPIRAMQLDVEQTAVCECAPGSPGHAD